MKQMSAKATAALDRVITRFQSGDLSPLFQVATLQRDPPLPFDTWSYRNRVLAYCQKDTTDLRGYRQWQRAGRQIRKGASAAYIWAPRHIPDPAAERDSEGNPTYRLAGFKPITVFSADDTDGDQPLPSSEPNHPEPPPLMDLAADLGINVQYMPNIPGAVADTDGKRVHLATHDTQIWFHELAHCLHRRTDPDDFTSSNTARKEAVADLTAAVLMEAYGLRDTSGNTWNYIRWFNKDPLKAIFSALGTVEIIVTYLQSTQKGA